MLGHIMEWFYEGLAGIGQMPGSTGYKHIRISPKVVGDCTGASANYESVHGMISSAWKLEKNYFELTVQIPANTDAEVVLPASVHATIYQNENSIKPIIQNNTAIVHVGSGTYTFVVK